MEIQIPLVLHRSQPLVIFGVAARTGTTLIMRLLNSTGQILIYGENKRLITFANDCADVLNFLTRLDETSIREVARIKSGDVNFWPSFNALANTVVPGHAAIFFQLLMIYLRDSKAHGFARWGMKNVLQDFQVIHTIQQLLPEAKIVVICRNLREVIRSQKARNFVATLEEVEVQCRLWRCNTERALAYRHRNYLLLHHEQLCRDRQTEIARLEAFAGIDGINHDVLDFRINTFRGNASEGHSQTEYIAPGTFTEEEAAVVRRYEDIGAKAEVVATVSA